MADPLHDEGGSPYLDHMTANVKFVKVTDPASPWYDWTGLIRRIDDDRNVYVLLGGVIEGQNGSASLQPFTPAQLIGMQNQWSEVPLEISG